MARRRRVRWDRLAVAVIALIILMVLGSAMVVALTKVIRQKKRKQPAR